MKKKVTYTVSKQDIKELKAIRNMLQAALDEVHRADNEGKDTVDMSTYLQDMKVATCILDGIVSCSKYLDSLTHDYL